MISERTLADGFGSTWESITPTMDRFVRRANRNADRIFAPIKNRSAPQRRGFINEVAFGLFAHRLKVGHKNNVDSDAVALIVKAAAVKIAAFEELAPEEVAVLTNDEKQEILELERAMLGYALYLHNETGVILPRPNFRGCGFVNECEGDLLVGTDLVEIKAGDRAFRAKDVRQLLVYCALNSVSSQYVIEKVTLFNPRRGLALTAKIADLAPEVSSKSASELMADISYFVSSGDISK